MTTEVLVDALPYFDHGYDDAGVRETSVAMVEEECRRYRPTKNYLEHLPIVNTTAFETELMLNEFDRIQNRLPMEPLSMKRYELPPPPPSKITELSAWADSVENSMAQLEHQAVRAINLELMLDYGCESWKVYLDVLTAMLAKAQGQLENIKTEIQNVNCQRKLKQMQAGEKLRSLETQWVMLVSKNYEIEQVCAKLEEQITKFKQQTDEQTNGLENGIGPMETEDDIPTEEVDETEETEETEDQPQQQNSHENQNDTSTMDAD